MLVPVNSCIDKLTLRNVTISSDNDDLKAKNKARLSDSTVTYSSQTTCLVEDAPKQYYSAEDEVCTDVLLLPTGGGHRQLGEQQN
jgi:hypothetical protein